MIIYPASHAPDILYLQTPKDINYAVCLSFFFSSKNINLFFLAHGVKFLPRSLYIIYPLTVCLNTRDYNYTFFY